MGVYFFLIYVALSASLGFPGQQKVTAFIESDGTVVTEAEHYASQGLTKTRKWYKVNEDFAKFPRGAGPAESSTEQVNLP